jgi:4-alpha-glucanotransferase
MSFPRRGGLLLHITSLPGRFGIGDLGPEARRFVDFLVEAGLGLWQVLPLQPPMYGDSPYATLSSFAWNPLLVSPEQLVEDGYLEAKELGALTPRPEGPVDYGAVIQARQPVLRRAWERFAREGSAEQRGRFEAFCSVQAEWLEDYALFAALKDAHGGREWPAWDRALVRREPAALAGRREKLASAIEEIKFGQYLFALQWNALHRHCAERGIELLGDVPIFVAHDSADVWAHPEIFQIEADGRLPVVAGVPPDAFSATGQRWGNPLYRWDVLKRTGFAWWMSRLRSVLSTVDIVRLDHFLGFLRAWAVPAESETALEGTWQPGPKADFFEALRREFGQLPLIAEDLGLLTAEAEALRDSFELPGMKVLQFAFDSGPAAPHLPHNSPSNAILYTGTHDNETLQGWLQEHRDAEGKPDKTARYALRYARTTSEDFHWGLIELAFASVCHTAIAPVQDVLGLGAEARMNRPGAAQGNWSWRLPPHGLTERHAKRLREIAETYGRAPLPAESAPTRPPGEAGVQKDPGPKAELPGAAGG